MKMQLIILIVLCLCININTNAQIKQKMVESMMGKGKSDNSKLPETYQFQWEYKTVIKSSGNEEMNMDYLINPDSAYFGMQISSEEYQQMDFMCIVTDPAIEISTTFMSSKNQNMAMLSKIPSDLIKKEKETKMSFKEIGTKEILGFECYGIELENADYIGTMYFTLDAPVSFKAIFAYSQKNTPKGFDPALLEVLAEEALLMEMNFENKKKKKQSFTMTAKSLEQKETTIITSDYQVMMRGF
jgi:hypothetical protein